MNIDITAFRKYSNVHYQSKTNLVLNSNGDGLTTTKARGGVNTLAGLLNIGTRAKYGRETLDALKVALKSEFKAQNKLTDLECDACVNKAFKDALGKDFDQARTKAIKLNPQSLRKILDAADKIIEENLNTKAVDMNDASTLAFDKTVAAHQELKFLTSSNYGSGFKTLLATVSEIRKNLNTEIVTRHSAEHVVTRLKDFAQTVECLKNGGTLKLGNVNPEYTSEENRLPNLEDLFKDLMTRIDNRIKDLEDMFLLNQ